MTIVYFKINNESINQCTQTEPSLMHKSEILTEHSKLYRDDIKEANKLISKNSNISHDLLYILYTGHLIGNDRDYTFWVKVCKILRLADLLKIPMLTTSHNCVIQTGLYYGMSYKHCFKLLEIRYGIKIINICRGTNKYEHMVNINIDSLIHIFDSNDIAPINNYFKNPETEDFVDLICRARHEFGKYFITVSNIFSGILLLDDIIALLEKDHFKLDIKESLSKILYYYRYGFWKFYEDHKIIHFLSLASREMIEYFQVIIIDILNGYTETIQPVNGDMILQFYIYWAILPFSYRYYGCRYSCYKIYTINRGLFLSLVLYGRDKSNCNFIISLLQYALKVGDRTITIKKNVNYILLRDLYKMYNYNIDSLFFESIESRQKFNHIVFGSSMTKPAVKKLR